MSSAIVLPTLTNWAKNHITAIFTATNATDFNSAMSAFLSDKAVITVNGVQTSRADFISQTQGEKFDEIGATVNFAGAVEVPSDPNQPINAGSVGLFFNAVITEGIRVLGAPISHQQTVSLNIVVAEDPDVPSPPPSPIRRLFDGRRVMVLNQVTASGPAPAETAA